ncbi:hypothetical protein PHMEG_00034724 [Phytophthora megakarya]|uniref:Uncharacterized protein n=1 Tax=Phytophthora megakarya TaxID=4795 RepID=A0A225UQF9_9STRA|nr:hypothetical protein PHMEG_00034724 [Phytophthora megakarya]
MAANKKCNITTSVNATKRIVRGTKREVECSDDEEPLTKRPYYGKCQYKTGKCYNERTVKRNGDAHSLCEEHRIKQNLIQRRSDRKYQTVHAIRRRERSQRRVMLKKQVSMAVAHQLFYEHQQQKTLDTPLLELNTLGAVEGISVPGIVDLAPPIQLLQPSVSLQDFESVFEPTLLLPYQPQNALNDGYTSSSAEIVNVTGAVRNVPVSLSDCNNPVMTDNNIKETSSTTNDCSCISFIPFSDVADMWSDDDIELLQTLLLT